MEETNRRTATSLDLMDAGFTLGVVNQNIAFFTEEAIDLERTGENGQIVVFEDDVAVIRLALERLRDDIQRGNVPAGKFLSSPPVACTIAAY